MEWTWITFYLLVILVLGTIGVLYEVGKKSSLSAQSLGLLFVFGAGSLGYGLFLFSLFGFKPTRWSFVCLGLLGLACIFFFVCNRELPLFKLQPINSATNPRHQFTLCVLIAVFVVFQGVVLIHALAFQMYEWDSYAIWGLKAKVVAMEALHPIPEYFTDVSLSYSHLDYPLMVPFLMAGLYGVLGYVDDHIAKLPMTILYLGLLCFVFSFSKRRLSTLMSSAVTLIVAGAPVMLRWAGSGNADVPLTTFYTASVIYLIEWQEKKRLRSCVLCGVMSAFAVLTKTEGLVLGTLNCTFMLLLLIRTENWKHRLKGAGVCITIYLFLSLPWIIWASDIPRTHENYLSHFRLHVILENTYRIPIILSEFARQILDVWRYGLLWPILIISALVHWRKFQNRSTRILWILFLLHMGIYAVVFYITPWNVQEQLYITLDRLVLHVVPLGGLLIAHHNNSQTTDLVNCSGRPVTI
jgi:hypothetical protein